MTRIIESLRTWTAERKRAKREEVAMQIVGATVSNYMTGLWQEESLKAIQQAKPRIIAISGLSETALLEAASEIALDIVITTAENVGVAAEADKNRKRAA